MASPIAQSDHYEVLGLAASATDEEIRRRYRFLALAFHPDRYTRNSDHHSQAERQIKQINEAYRILSDPQLRAAFDHSRRLSANDAGYMRSSASVYAQSLQEMARSSQRLHQVEQELLTARERLERSDQANALLNARLAELEQLRSSERTSLDAEQRALRQQVEQMAREQSESERALRSKLERAERKLKRLEQDAERKNDLIERLKHAKVEWDVSSQNRVDLLTQRIERLRAELEDREQQLAEALGGRQRLQQQMSQEQHSTQYAVQRYSSALSISETEAARLQIELDALAATQQRGRTITRLWQIAAVIGIVNTVILLVIALQWLRGG
ncbi:MAG: DnaJ domain-containing protein [Caldilinea sp.]